MMDSEFQLL